jgi:hypothetical protein
MFHHNDSQRNEALTDGDTRLSHSCVVCLTMRIGMGMGQQWSDYMYVWDGLLDTVLMCRTGHDTLFL